MKTKALREIIAEQKQKYDPAKGILEGMLNSPNPDAIGRINNAIISATDFELVTIFFREICLCYEIKQAGVKLNSNKYIKCNALYEKAETKLLNNVHNNIPLYLYIARYITDKTATKKEEWADILYYWIKMVKDIPTEHLKEIFTCASQYDKKFHDTLCRDFPAKVEQINSNVQITPISDTIFSKENLADLSLPILHIGNITQKIKAEINRLDHCYRWNGRVKAQKLRQALTDATEIMQEDAINKPKDLDAFFNYKKDKKNSSIADALKFHRCSFIGCLFFKGKTQAEKNIMVQEISSNKNEKTRLLTPQIQ